MVKKTKVVAMRLTSDEHEAITNLARRRNKSFAETLREIVEKGLPKDQQGNVWVRGTAYRSRCTYCRKALQLQTGIWLERKAWAHEECEAANGLQS